MCLLPLFVTLIISPHLRTVGFLIGVTLDRVMTVEMFHEMQMSGLEALLAHYEAEKERRPLLHRAGLVSEKLGSSENDLTKRDLRVDVLTD